MNLRHWIFIALFATSNTAIASWFEGMLPKITPVHLTLPPVNEARDSNTHRFPSFGEVSTVLPVVTQAAFQGEYIMSAVSVPNVAEVMRAQVKEQEIMRQQMISEISPAWSEHNTVVMKAK